MTQTDRKYLEAKRNHHHVWANYMKRWSPDNKQVYYTTKKNNDIRFDSVKNIAVERDFYRVKPLTSEHIQIIKKWSSESSEDLRKLHMSFLNDYLDTQDLELLYHKIGKKDDIADKMFEACKSNGIENYHSALENEVQELLDALINRDLSILDKNDNMLKFMRFLGQQIARTKNFKDNISNTADNHIKTLTLECWWFISFMFGLNIGRALYLNRKDYTHCLLINETDTPFITSDQPVVNVHSALTDEIKSLKNNEVDFYYPISPKIAYMINKSNRFPHGTVKVSFDVIEEVNIKIAKQANFHIISNSEESLKPYKKFVGSNFKSVKSTLKAQHLNE